MSRQCLALDTAWTLPGHFVSRPPNALRVFRDLNILNRIFVETVKLTVVIITKTIINNNNNNSQNNKKKKHNNNKVQVLVHVQLY